MPLSEKSHSQLIEQEKKQKVAKQDALDVHTYLSVYIFY
jgi:hypothetical protein